MGGGKVCSLCDETKTQDAFSKKQWAGKAHARRCLGCIAAGEHVQRPAEAKASACSGLDAKGSSSDEGDECLVCLDDILTVTGNIWQVKY